MAPRITADSVDDYLAACPPEQRASLSELRRILLDAIPGATEGISYGIPIFYYRGKGILGISSAAHHASLHIMASPPLAVTIADGVTEGSLSGSTLQFTPEQPLSEDAVLLIAARRVALADSP